MRKIKVRYVAQVIIDDWINADDNNVLPLEDIKENLPYVTDEIKRTLYEYLTDNANVQVTEQFCDAWEVEG